jgi:hypothetical protein
MWYSRMLTTEGSYCFHELSTQLSPYPANVMAEYWLETQMEGMDLEAKRRRMVLQTFPRYFHRFFGRMRYGQSIVGNSDSTIKLAIAMYLLWPSTKFIFSVRNGINTVQSLFSLAKDIPRPVVSQLEDALQTPEFFTIACHQWRDMMEGMESAMGWLQGKAEILQVKFEDVTGSLEELKIVWDWLDIPNWEGNESRNARLIRTPVNARTNARGVKPPEDIWCLWSAAQRNDFRTICGEAMRRNGYSVPAEDVTLV